MIKEYLDRFLNRKEHVPEVYEERAFDYTVYKTPRPYSVAKGDLLRAQIVPDSGEPPFTVEEEVDRDMVVDSVAIFRTKEAFGMTDVVGAAFGKSK
jgi:hypothetical protein